MPFLFKTRKETFSAASDLKVTYSEKWKSWGGTAVHDTLEQDPLKSLPY